MGKASLVFCASALIFCGVAAAVAFPYAALSREQIEAARTPLLGSQMGLVDLGGFGMVPVRDLVEYYVENPPAPEVGVLARKVHFEGC